MAYRGFPINARDLQWYSYTMATTGTHLQCKQILSNHKLKVHGEKNWMQAKEQTTKAEGEGFPFFMGASLPKPRFYLHAEIALVSPKWAFKLI